MSENLEFNRHDLVRINETAGLSFGVNQLDEYEFGELIATDQLWGSLVDGTTPDVDEMRHAEKYNAYAKRLEKPNTLKHILGGFYIQTLNEQDGWVNINRIISKWLGGFTANPPTELVDKLHGILKTLRDDGLIEQSVMMRRLHPDYRAELDFSSVDDDFEEVVKKYLAKRPLGSYATFSTLAYLKHLDPEREIELVDPFEYWGVRYELEHLLRRGVAEYVPNEHAIIRIPATPYVNIGQEQDDLDSRITNSRYTVNKIGGVVLGENLDQKLHEAGFIRPPKVRKPRQRGRWKN